MRWRVPSNAGRAAFAIAIASAAERRVRDSFVEMYGPQ